ncbi:hypothetical protein [Kitasatospora arboriphila]|uniref:Uncharacterized protein n=1 Tax=Kitasatospora arboriphila TaxID=258052 RepID=A0ABN1T9U4_9ACTN
MTLDGFAGAERIAATLDVLAEALLDERATHYAAGSLTAFRRDDHPSADALFGLRIAPGGPGVLTVRGLGTVVEGGTARGTGSAAGATAALAARFGAGEVRGVAVDAAAGDAVPGAFRLPVVPEPGDVKLRPPFTAALAALASERPTRAPEELSTGSGTEVRLVVPPVFHPLTARGDGASVAAHLAEVAEELFAGAGPAARRDWSVIAASLAGEAAAAGVVFAGLCALAAEGRTSHASLTVSLHRHSGPADQLAVRLADARPHAEVWTVLLPAGPAALLVEPRTSPVPAELAADGRRRWAVSSVAQAVLPLPDGATTLVLQLGTVQAEDWELYAGVFADVLQSVQLGWDGVGAARPQPVAEPVAAAPAPPAPPAPLVPAPPVPVEPSVTAPTLPQAVFEQPPAVPPMPPAPPVVPAPAAEPVPAPAPVPPAPVAAEPVLASVAEAAPAPAPERPKGTPVRVPPPDFNPFAPPAPAPAAAEPAAQEAPPGPGKGTPVRVPPPDFNPFAPPAPSAQAAPAAPAPAPVAAAPAPAAPAKADPFGTVVTNEPQDPFGTVTSRPAPAAAAPAAPAPAPATPAPATAAAPPGPGKGTPVRVPPPDFNPFAPPAPAPAAAEPAAQEAPPGPGKGTPVRVPPPDFNPFAPPAPSAQAAPAAPPAPEEPPSYSPFG